MAILASYVTSARLITDIKRSFWKGAVCVLGVALSHTALAMQLGINAHIGITEYTPTVGPNWNQIWQSGTHLYGISGPPTFTSLMVSYPAPVGTTRIIATVNHTAIPVVGSGGIGRLRANGGHSEAAAGPGFPGGSGTAVSYLADGGGIVHYDVFPIVAGQTGFVELEISCSVSARLDAPATGSVSAAVRIAGALNRVFAVVQDTSGTGTDSDRFRVVVPIGSRLSVEHQCSVDSMRAAGSGFPITYTFAQSFVDVIPVRSLQDQDSDEIPDDWEINGIPYYDPTGILRRYILDVDGDGLSDASPLQKDLFVEIDAGAGMTPSPIALQQVIAAFDPPGKILIPAPAGVAGGLPNIRLHLQTSPPHLALPLANGGHYGSTQASSWSDDLQADKALFFGLPSELGDFALLAAKQQVYRYCMFARSNNGGTSTGVAEGLVCDDFLVTLGTLIGGSAEEQAGTFMHELGHSLGLGHGGGDHINYKPNYPSVMNYHWQLPNAWQGGRWSLRYSESALPTLDEALLVEGLGVGLGPDILMPFRHQMAAPCPGTVCVHALGSCMSFAQLPSTGPVPPVDWSGDCTISTAVVSGDINDFSFLHGGAHPHLGSGLQELTGFHDWAHLRFNFNGSPHSLAGAPVANLACNYNQQVRTFYAAIGGSLGTSYCAALPTSSGLPGAISLSGSPEVVDQNLTMIAQDLPVATSGYFLASLQQGSSLPIPGSSGRLCLSGSIGRFIGPGQVQTANPLGGFSLALPNLTMPLPAGPVPVLPGDTWYFQAWFRDANPTPTSNFTNAVSLTFQ